jgi:ribonucleoside-triphosphate reductase (formate)
MDPELYGEDDRSEAVQEDSSDIELLVRRSDDDLALFDSQRIVDALVRETNLDRELATQISLDVRRFIEKLGPRALSSSLIRGLVDAKLLELGLEEAHRAHTRLGVPFYDVHRIIQSSFRESSCHPCGPEGTSLMLAEAIKREYAIQSVFSEQIANAHLVGDIHIHEIGAIDRPYSIMSSVDYVKQFGISLPQGFASSSPARRADVLIAHITKVSAAMEGYISGPVVWDSLNYFLAPFLAGLDINATKQLAQALVFEFSAPAVAHSGQSVFADLHLDWEAPFYLKSVKALGPSGLPMGKTYGEYMPEAQRFLQTLLDVFIEGDALGRTFFTPRLLLHINRRFNEMPGYRGILEQASRLAVERGGFTIAFDRDDDRAFARRYGVDDDRSAERAESHSWRSAQLQVVSLNLPRVGYLASGDQLKVFEELTRLMEVAAQAHLEKRVFLEKLLALGEKGPLALLAARTSGVPLLRLAWTTHSVGVVGLNELCRAVLGADIHHSEETLEFALRVLTHLKRESRRLSNKHKARFLLTGRSNELAAARLARLDLRLFGATAGKVVFGDVAGDAAYYTDSVRLAASSDVTVLDRVRTEGIFHQLGLTDIATEIWMGSVAPTAEDLGRLISQAFYQSSCLGLVFCPEFTACADCGRHTGGLHADCGHCGSDRTDWLAYGGDRYGYTSSWDPGRLSELKDRKRVSDVSPQ